MNNVIRYEHTFYSNELLTCFVALFFSVFKSFAVKTAITGRFECRAADSKAHACRGSK